MQRHTSLKTTPTRNLDPKPDGTMPGVVEETETILEIRTINNIKLKPKAQRI